MQQISFYLEKFKNIGLKELLLKEVVVDSIKKITKTNIQPSSIEVKENQIFIRTTPIAKSEIFIHKKEILDEIEAVLSKKIKIL